MPGVRPAAVALSFEKPQPWELAQGSAVVRTLKVSTDAQRVYMQQEQILPTIHHDYAIDPAVTEHLHDVGRRVLILRENAKKPDKVQQRILEKSAPKRVIPNRFRESDEHDDGGSDNDDPNGDDAAATDARIATMLMDQEWDTRTWSTAKVHGAVETLYSEIEHSDDEKRRELATTMLVRLLEIHEDAVDFVETTIPVLMNKAFRSLSKLTNRAKAFRVARLLAVLAEWFAPVMSRENAAGKSIRCLLRETEICARIVQHHWRSVLFERGLLRKEHDASVCARLRAMHLVKHLELRHQFKVLREAIGPNGLPDSAVESYVTVLYHLVRQGGNSGSGANGAPSTSPHEARSSRSAAVADQKKVVASGVLVFLASLVRRTHTSRAAEMAKAIVKDIATTQGSDSVADVLVCNIVHRAVWEVEHLMTQRVESTSATLVSSLSLVATLADATLRAKWVFESPSSPEKVGVAHAAARSIGAGFDGGSEHAYRLKVLAASAKKHLVAPFIVHMLFHALQYDSANASLCVTVLNTLRHLASAFGFPEVLDALTRSGGRCLEAVLLLFDHADPSAVAAAVLLFYELTDRPDARKGLTTAGAPQLLLNWCSVAIESSKTPALHVLGLIGIALLARQTHHATSPAKLLASLTTLAERIDVLYSLLLDLALDMDAADKSVLYLLTVNALPSLLQFLLQVKPSCMGSAFQSAHQRNVSCIVLGRAVKVPQVAELCFSEDLVNHLALSLQCNRLDEIEHLVARMSAHERRVHVMGSKEACKALSRLSRCPSTSVDARLKPSLTSASVPELPQAVICDAVFRLHTLEDLIANIKSPSDGAEFAELELELTLAAVELGGYLRPLPFGDAARAKFLKASGAGQPLVHVTYASEKLLALIELVAPAILQVLREKSACFELVSACCAALSRLACTNAACSLLLSQGCLQVVFIHLPEILFAVSPNRRSARHHQSYAHDSSVDDHGLLDVPASLFTLVGKLCAVADGRAAVMRAQVLPRLLKRLQLRSEGSKTVDEDCKGEIAIVVQRLAMINAVEGNTSELFLHFHVLELMAQLAQEQDIASALHTRGKHHKWRLLDHAVGAIAALSQDVLVCVPKIAELGILPLVLPFILRERKDEAAARADSLQYHALSIVRSVAAYPFGKYHTLLQSIEDSRSSSASRSSGGESAGQLPARLLDRVKKVAYNFTLELENRPTSSLDRKTVSELARETLTFIHDCAERAGAISPPLSASSAMVSLQATQLAESRRASTRLSIKPGTSLMQEERGAFPALPGSPLSSQQRELARVGAMSDGRAHLQASGGGPRAAQPLSPGGTLLAPMRSTPLLPSQLSPQRALSSQSLASLHTFVGSAAAGGIAAFKGRGALNLSGVDMMLTRPTASKPQSSADSDERHQQQQQQPGRRSRTANAGGDEHGPAPYVFARPKSKNMKKSKHDAVGCCLMLDPLFQSSPGGSAPRFSALDGDQRHRKHKSAVWKSSATAARDSDLGLDQECSSAPSSSSSFVYVQEVDRLGHCVSVKARRATAGDMYVRSLGHIITIGNGGGSSSTAE